MDRKEMVKALESHFRVKATYLGTPSFAYEIKTEKETYKVERTSAIKHSKGNEVDLDSILKPKDDEVIEPVKSYDDLVDGFEIEFPFEGHTGVTLRNVVNMIASKQRLIMQAFDSNEKFVEESFAEVLNQKETNTIELFKESYLACRPERCLGIVFDFETGTFVLKLDAQKLDKAKIDAFINLAVLVNKNAKMLKHSAFKPAQDENPKYALRTWLIRLGMNGDEYKISRKILLSGLEGSSSFRRPREEKDKS